MVQKMRESTPTRSASLISLEMEEWKSSGHNGNKQMEWIPDAICKMAGTRAYEMCSKAYEIPKQVLLF